MCISILEAKFVRKKCALYTGKYGNPNKFIFADESILILECSCVRVEWSTPLITRLNIFGKSKFDMAGELREVGVVITKKETEDRRIVCLQSH